jgi:hypothetical protein
MYRITVLEKNQQLTQPLISLLSAVPTTYTVGAAAAINLLSKFASTSKCSFRIFSTYEDAKNFNFGCYTHKIPISKYVGRFSSSSSNCLQTRPKHLWFGFKNENLLMDEKIIIEIVPWVNKKESRGWTLEIKNEFINYCKNNIDLSEISAPEEFCQCLLEKYQNNYKVQEIKNSTDTERKKIQTLLATACLEEPRVLKNISDNHRKEADKLGQEAMYGDAIDKLLIIVNTNNATITD